MTQPPINAQLLAPYKILLEMFSFQVWGEMWVAVGIICLISAVFGRRLEVFGFAAAELLLSLWSTGLLISFIETRYYRGILSVSVYFSLAVLFLIIGSWPERVSDDRP